MSEEKIVTEGGYTAIQVNGMTIRESFSNKRLDDDNETFVEYKVRLKLFKKMKKAIGVK